MSYYVLYFLVFLYHLLRQSKKEFVTIMPSATRNLFEKSTHRVSYCRTHPFDDREPPFPARKPLVYRLFHKKFLDFQKFLPISFLLVLQPAPGCDARLRSPVLTARPGENAPPLRSTAPAPSTQYPGCCAPRGNPG